MTAPLLFRRHENGDLDASQVAAQALYRKCGYWAVGHVTLGGVECIVYEKHLSLGQSGMIGA